MRRCPFVGDLGEQSEVGRPPIGSNTIRGSTLKRMKSSNTCWRNWRAGLNAACRSVGSSLRRSSFAHSQRFLQLKVELFRADNLVIAGLILFSDELYDEAFWILDHDFRRARH